MSTPSRPNASLSPWSIHDDVRTASNKGDESPSIKAINFKDADMGMTTTLTARDLRNVNYPEFVAWVQDILQACWSVAGKNYKPVYELFENRIFEKVMIALSLGHKRSVIAEVIGGSECTLVARRLLTESVTQSCPFVTTYDLCNNGPLMTEA